MTKKSIIAQIDIALAGLFVIMVCLCSAGAAEHIKTIRFAAGASATELRGSVVRGERDVYRLTAIKDQKLVVRVTSVENNAVFQIYNPGAQFATHDSAVQITGQTLPDAGEGDDAMRWSGRLPESGAYLFVVGPTRGNANYKLTVSIH